MRREAHPPAVDFFARQAAARRQTRLLVLGFALALTAVVLALDAVLFWVLAIAQSGFPVLTPFEFARLNPGIAATCTLIVLAVLVLASLFKSLQLRAGGGAVARALGGVRVGRDTTDLRLRRLLNVVEEMAIASGVPVPEVYVLEHEAGINAFAAGHTPANAAVAVTRGALERLDREQLQGVIAHEFSHILNGDMRLNVQLIGWLFGLFVLTFIGRTILRGSHRARDRGAPLIVATGLALVVIGYVGLLSGRILQAAVSRQRERLADASAVQFTRNPQGLKRALLAIAALPAGSRLTAVDAENVAHMLFAAGLTRRLFATHPPLVERIRALDPHFDVRELERLEALSMLTSGGTMDAPGVARLTESSDVAEPIAAQPERIAACVGNPDDLDVRRAHAIHLALPPEVRELTGSPDRAGALVLALLLSHIPQVRARQLRLLADARGAEEAAAVERAAVHVDRLAPLLRLPALQEAFPALRALPLADRRALARLAHALIVADARIEIFEFCLARLLERLIEDDLQARPPHGRLTLAQVEHDLHVLFAVLARSGAENEAAARMAYEAGISRVLPRHRPPYAAITDWTSALDMALARLDRLQAPAKELVVEGLVRTIAHDGWMSVGESELLRTVCALLHCPLPPFAPADERANASQASASAAAG